MKLLFKRIQGEFLIRKKKLTPLVIVMVDGGLGSQLSKYFIGQIIKRNTNSNVKFDLGWFKSHGKSIDFKDNRRFELTEVFKDLEFPIATEEEVFFCKTYFRCKNKKTAIFNEDILNAVPPCYVDGYFLHWKYLEEYKKTGLKALEFNLTLSDGNQKTLNAIKADEASVAVHVRRGDYLGSFLHVTTAGYFINAINHMRGVLAGQNPVFYFFSNGMDWVKEQVLPRLPKSTNVCLVEGNDNDRGAVDFYLLSTCKHQINSNASFGFLGSFINNNKDKKVIIPQYWYKDTKNLDRMDEESGMACRYPGWIVMSNDGAIISD